ncbi:MAG: metallophosphoesterase [Armatimonas sp.]
MNTFTTPDVLQLRERTGEPEATQALLRLYKSLPPVAEPTWANLDAIWTFALGSPQEELNVTADRIPEKREVVTLPQRTLHPDTPYWYVTEVSFSEPTVLAIDADDGAQVFANSQRIPVQGDYFFLPASPANTKTRLIVRVLNKAAYGGLEEVRMTSQVNFERYQQATEKRRRVTVLVKKTRLLCAPTKVQLAAVEKAVAEADTEDALQAAEKVLAELPLTLIGPYLQDASSDQMTIVWETDVPCTGTLEWGLEGEPGQQAQAKSEGNLHSATLTGLKPGTMYRYRARSGDVIGPEYSFRTLPTSGAFAFTAWGDSQVNARTNNNRDVFRQNVSAMACRAMAFSVGVGDLVEQGHHQEPWQVFFEALAPLATDTPVMLIGGNHDYDGCFEDLHSVFFERYARSKPKSQYYAWTASNARFVALDPNEHFPTGIPAGSEQHRWLMQELESEAWRAATWRFLFIHQPPFSQGWLDYQGDLPIRALLEPLMEKHGIDFVVSGHTHDYERWTRTYGNQTVHYLILGGAGGGLEGREMSPEPVMDKVIRRHHFGLFQVDGRKVTFEAIATDTRVLDSLEVSR